VWLEARRFTTLCLAALAPCGCGVLAGIEDRALSAVGTGGGGADPSAGGAGGAIACDEPLSHVDGKRCFFVNVAPSSSTANWYEHRTACTQRGGDLAIIGNSDDQFDVSQLALSYDNSISYWIGLSDEAEEGTWRWVDGSMLGDDSWMPTEPKPDSAGTEYDCATMQFGSEWAASVCTSATEAAICERDLTAP
jgi:hypothetical protein